MSIKVFVDGQAGTTGMMIHKRLSERNDLEIISIDHELRKDNSEKSRIMNSVDVVFLCLPDSAAKESVSLIQNPDVTVIDASTAHRTDNNWDYGIPELSEKHLQALKKSKRISVPGCYATGFITLMYPLVKEDLIPADTPIFCHGLSGHSGAGHKMISRYKEEENSSPFYQAPHHYALGLNHKHLPEMKIRTGLEKTPLFNPIICNYERGMAVAVPLFIEQLSPKASLESVHDCLSSHYEDSFFVNVSELGNQEPLIDGLFYDPTGCNDTNNLEISVWGNKEQIFLISRLDNLGKGASGAAVQCMNISQGLDEKAGLV